MTAFNDGFFGKRNIGSCLSQRLPDCGPHFSLPRIRLLGRMGAEQMILDDVRAEGGHCMRYGNVLIPQRDIENCFMGKSF